MTVQTIQFDATSLRQVGSGAITAFLFSDAALVGTLGSIAENATLDGRYTGTVSDVAAGTYRLVVRYNGYDDSDPEYQVTLLLAVGTYIAVRLAVLDSAALRGGLTIPEGLDLILAGVVGVSSQPSADTEEFKFVDGESAFVTTFDTSENRSAVVLS